MAALMQCFRSPTSVSLLSMFIADTQAGAENDNGNNVFVWLYLTDLARFFDAKNVRVVVSAYKKTILCSSSAVPKHCTTSIVVVVLIITRACSTITTTTLSKHNRIFYHKINEILTHTHAV